MSEQYEVDRFARNLARRLARLERAQKRTAASPNTLNHAAVDGGDFRVKDQDGNTVYHLGTDPFTGVTSPKYEPGPKPSTPEAPEVQAREGAVQVSLSGVDVDERRAPEDLRRVEVHVSLDQDFVPSPGTLKGGTGDPHGVVTAGAPAGQWWVRIVWVTLSGQRSEPSVPVGVDVATIVDQDQIQEVVDDTKHRLDDAREYADQQFEAFDERVESAETDLNDAHDRIDAAEGALSSTQSDLDDAKADITAAQSAADQAVADALAAADLAEGKGQVITQVSAPTGSRARAENLWVRLPDMKVHYYDGDKWKPVLDPDTIAAAQQAADALTKANDLQTKHDALQLAVDGEGGLKDRLSTAENTLEDKAASSDLQELDDILRGTEDLPPQIADRFYAAMAIVEKLQAVSGWVGGVNLQDGAVTAEKIEATREMITKIMGAEWAYIAEQLVVDGDLIANNADIISAVIKNLDVTEQSNFNDAFAQKLGTKEFTALVATMARTIIAAPNLLPAPDADDASEFWSPISRNTNHPSVWIQGRYTRRSTGTVRLDAGEEYRFKTAVAASVANTRYYIQLVGTGSTPNLYIASNQTAGASQDDWAEYESTFTVAETGDYHINIYANHNNGVVGEDNYQWFRTPRIERMLDGRLTVPGSIDVGKLNVTEEMVASFARILHLVVDQIDVNSLWADTTWQQAGHFGTQHTDYRTMLDAMGLSIFRQVEGEEQLATRLGPGENALSFFDEDTGELAGGLSQDGSANLAETSVQSLTIAGRDLTHQPHTYQPGVPILDSMPRGVWVAGPVDMAGVEEDRNRYGFLELTANVVQGRVYRLSTNNFLMGTDKSYRGRFRHTISPDGSLIPTVNSDELGAWIINQASSNAQEGGRTIFVAEQTGVLRVLLCVETQNSSTIGIRFNATTSWAGNIQMWLEDLGTNKNAISRRRFSATGGPTPDFLDNTPGKSTYITEWEATWRAAYYNGGTTRRTGTTPNYGYSLPQGLNERLRDHGAWTSICGFDGATSSTHTSEQGLSFQTALNGAEIQSVVIITTGAGSLGNDHRFFQRLHWAPNTTAPNTYTRNVSRHIGGGRIDPGTTKEWEVPQEYWALLQTGDWRSLGLADTDYDNDINKGWLSWDDRPRIVVTYQK